MSANSGNTLAVVSSVAKALSGSGLVGAVAGATLAAAGLAIKLGTDSVQAAGDFQQAMLSNVAHAGLAKSQFDAVSQSVLGMATAVGRDPTQLAEALYPILSAFSGIQDQSAKSALALNTLRMSFQTVAGTTVDGTAVAKAAVQTFNSLGLATNNTAINTQRMTSLMDIMDKTVQLGNTTWDDYKGAVSKVALAIQGTNVTFNESQAALALMTNSGFPSAQKASTYLSNTFNTLEIKTNALATHAKKLGISFDLAKYGPMSLAQKIEYLNQITDGNKQKLLALMGNNSTALRTFNALSTGIDSYKSNLDALNHSQGALAASFATASQGFNFQMEQMKAAGQVILVTFGTALLPVVSSLMAKIVPLIGQFTTWITKSGLLKQVAQELSSGLTTLMGFVQGLISPLNTCGGAFDGAHRTIQAVADILPSVGDFLASVGTSVEKNLVPPIESLVTNTENAVANFTTWLDTSGTAKNVLQDLAGMIDFASGMLGTMIGWVATLVGWLGGGGAGTDTLVGVLLVLAGAFVALKIADATAQFSSVVTKLQEGDGMIANIASSIKDKMASALDDFLKNQAPNFKQALDTFKSSAQGASEAEAAVGVEAEGSATKVTIATGTMDADMAGVTASAGEAATASEGIGAASLAGSAVALGSFAAIGVGLAALAVQWKIIGDLAQGAPSIESTGTKTGPDGQQYKGAGIQNYGGGKSWTSPVSDAASQIKATVADMQQSVTNSVTLMNGNVVQSMNEMNVKSYADTSSFTTDAMNMFQKMGTYGTQQMQSLDKNTIGYWNDVAAYIANHPINASININTNVGNTYQKLSRGLQGNYYASGVQNAPAGWAVVGENGPEMMYVPGGSNIYPNTGRGGSPLASVGGGSAGGPTVFNFNPTIQIEGRSYQTDEDLANALQNKLADMVRAQFSMLPTLSHN